MSTPKPTLGEIADNTDFLAGICVALSIVKRADEGTTWKEIVQTVGEDTLIDYAAFVEPQEWECAGFARYAALELRRRKPRVRFAAGRSAR